MPANPLAALYPAPPQPPQNILGGNPLFTIGILGQLNANARFQQEFAAQKAVGSAYQNALNPDGTVDQGKLVEGLHNPAAAFAAPEAISTMLAQRSQEINNAQNSFKLSSGQNDYILNQIAGLANKPGVTRNDLANAIVSIGRTNPNIPSNVLTSYLMGAPGGGQALTTYLRDLGTRALGPQWGAARTPAVAPSGATVSIPQGEAIYGPGGAVPTSLPPGVPEQFAANRAAYIKDQGNSASILSAVRPLQQTLPLIEQMDSSDFGPGSEGFAKIKGALEMSGVIPQNSTDLEVRQELNKKLHQYVTMQRGAGRSDEALQQAIASNPNVDLTQGANLNLVKNQIALDREDAAVTHAYDAMHPGGKGVDYNQFKSNYYQNNDTRAFEFDMMSPQERQKIVQSLGKKGSPAWKKFNRSLNLAVNSGLFAPPQQ